ncbi:hypothetical protein HC026_01345 [Lactobacillus sp. LC28-10]|uniref:Uncharacterized protein n=1 Tax=Secundilactobacillus angelensis TaxID=2722706 RepID=A0ABX1KXJ1_9LACO|nr:hypothetical protein [Secundilactobacillus angelensis]MCH5461246.1 hypothetical protein [Secundilactobacillus angelensis]NLR17558.1 hypothetical protein [Secundilactobacillus angelensis]
MNTMPKWLLWLLLLLNIILIGFLITMNNMAAMWMMAVIMLLDSVGSLVVGYRK